MKKENVKKIVLLVAVLGLLYTVLHFSGLTTDFSLEKLQNLVQSAGWFGVVIYLVLFSVCLLLYFPGLLFIFLAVLVYGPVYGCVIAYAGATLATSSNFLVVRKFGGQPVQNIKNKRFLKVVASLENKPIRTMIIIRMFFWLAPYITYFLAFSSIRNNKYHVGNAIGLIPVILFFGLGFYFFQDWMMQIFVK